MTQRPLIKTSVRIHDEVRNIEGDYDGLYVMEDGFGQLLGIDEISFTYHEEYHRNSISKRLGFSLTVSKPNPKLKFLSDLPSQAIDAKASLLIIILPIRYALFVPKLIVSEQALTAGEDEFEGIYSGVALGEFRIVYPYESEPMRVMTELTEGIRS